MEPRFRWSRSSYESKYLICCTQEPRGSSINRNLGCNLVVTQGATVPPSNWSRFDPFLAGAPVIWSHFALEPTRTSRPERTRFARNTSRDFSRLLISGELLGNYKDRPNRSRLAGAKKNNGSVCSLFENVACYIELLRDVLGRKIILPSLFAT